MNALSVDGEVMILQGEDEQKHEEESRGGQKVPEVVGVVDAEGAGLVEVPGLGRALARVPLHDLEVVEGGQRRGKGSHKIEPGDESHCFVGLLLVEAEVDLHEGVVAQIHGHVDHKYEK